jgi:hypothetical protein
MPAVRYRIVVAGRLSARFAAGLPGLAIERAGPRTLLLATVRDRAELYGLLDRLRDLGVDLVAVEPADEEAAP